MHALKVLHNKLQQACPFIHKKRLAILVLAIHALLIGQRLSFSQGVRSFIVLPILLSFVHGKTPPTRISRRVISRHLKR